MSARESVPLTVDDVRPPQLCAGSCGRWLDPTAPDVLRSVEGWFASRKGGGIHHIKFKHETGKVLCRVCARSLSDTGILGQGRLV